MFGGEQSFSGQGEVCGADELALSPLGPTVAERRPPRDEQGGDEQGGGRRCIHADSDDEQGAPLPAAQVAARAAFAAILASNWTSSCVELAFATVAGAVPQYSWVLLDSERRCAGLLAGAASAEAARAAADYAERARLAWYRVAVFADPTLTRLQAARLWSRQLVIERTWDAEERLRARGRVRRLARARSAGPAPQRAHRGK